MSEAKIFPAAINGLLELKRSAHSNPALQSELETAIQILQGDRPNVGQKYTALLLKLDRTMTQYQDRRDNLQKQLEVDLPCLRAQKLKARLAAINSVITDLQWMKARNADLIKLFHHPKP